MNHDFTRMWHTKQKATNKQTQQTLTDNRIVVSRGQGDWGGRGEEKGKGDQIYGDTLSWAVSTQRSVQTLYYKVVHLKFILCY